MKMVRQHEVLDAKTYFLLALYGGIAFLWLFHLSEAVEISRFLGLWPLAAVGFGAVLAASGSLEERRLGGGLVIFGIAILLFRWVSFEGVSLVPLAMIFAGFALVAEAIGKARHSR